jgi:hypothetical protein
MSGRGCLASPPRVPGRRRRSPMSRPRMRSAPRPGNHSQAAEVSDSHVDSQATNGGGRTRPIRDFDRSWSNLGEC